MTEESRNRIEKLKRLVKISFCEEAGICEDMLIFLDNLPDLEKQCKKGGWIPDNNLKPCKSGDRIRLLDGIYSNWIAELYWNYKEKAFYYKPISVYGVVSNSFYKPLMLLNTRFIKYEK